MTELLACRKLACGYDGEVVVSGVDLSVSEGEILTILGGSGSGKSTLLKTLVGLLRPISGTLRLMGLDPFELEGGERRRLYRDLGMLYQSDALLASVSVLDNVSLPLRELTRLPDEVVERAARSRIALVDLLEIEDSSPTEISGGQSKRAALARASILDPALLFCDEPTSGLDPIAAAQIDALLLRFRDLLGMAVVAVTHDVASVRTIADYSIVLADGGVCAQGTLDELEHSRVPVVQQFFQRNRGDERQVRPA